MGKTGCLVEPKTTIINRLIHENVITVFGVKKSYYIGVNDIKSEGNWVYSSTGLPATTMFSDSQPNEGTSANCVTRCYGRDDEQWCDTACDDLHGIICEF